LPVEIASKWPECDSDEVLVVRKDRNTSVMGMKGG
jgi:hypothetical protein